MHIFLLAAVLATVLACGKAPSKPLAGATDTADATTDDSCTGTALVAGGRENAKGKAKNGKVKRDNSDSPTDRQDGEDKDKDKLENQNDLEDEDDLEDKDKLENKDGKEKNGDPDDQSCALTDEQTRLLEDGEENNFAL